MKKLCKFTWSTQSQNDSEFGNPYRYCSYISLKIIDLNPFLNVLKSDQHCKEVNAQALETFEKNFKATVINFPFHNLFKQR